MLVNKFLTCLFFLFLFSCNNPRNSSNNALVQLSTEGKPLGCWKVHESIGIDPAFFFNDKGVLTVINTPFRAVPVENGDWDGAFAKLGIKDVSQCQE